jgi:hypothetical protein
MAGRARLDAPLETHEGNTVSGFLLALPVDAPTPSERLRRIVVQTRTAKASQIATLIGALARCGLRQLPRVLLPHVVPRVASGARFCGISSLRGPAHATFQRCEVESVYFYGTFHPPRMPLMIGCCSVSDRMRVTLALQLDTPLSAGEVLRGLPAALTELREEVCNTA